MRRNSSRYGPRVHSTTALGRRGGGGADTCPPPPPPSFSDDDDGNDDKLLDWIEDSGVVALCSDNQAVEGFAHDLKAGPNGLLPLHERCLFKLGIHLGELWWLGDLARHLEQVGRHAFLLTAPPLRLTGAVGSPATPVATV